MEIIEGNDVIIWGKSGCFAYLLLWHERERKTNIYLMERLAPTKQDKELATPIFGVAVLLIPRDIKNSNGENNL